MTREEAIVYGNDYYADLISACCKIDEKHKEFVRMSLEALEQEPCEDCISRKAILEEIENGIKAGNYEEGYEEYPHINDMDDIIECIKYADSIQPKTGRWIEEPNCWTRCSCCGEHYPQTSIYGFIGSNYCPNCGARMSESKYYAELSKVFAQGLRQGLQDGFVESEDKE